MSAKKRLLGIDLLRGIAAYSVILVHSGDKTWGIPVEQSAISFRLFFYFAVPFFLATSFYLMANKPNIDTSNKFWRSRIERLLIPYVLWTIIYIALKLIILPLTNQTEQINTILQDPLAIIFFGASSYHLYFLPLLFTGSFLIFLAKYLKKKQIRLRTLILLSLISIIGRQLLIYSNNSFVLGSNIAFSSWLNLVHSDDGIGYSFARLILVQLAWLLRCLPYLLIAMTITYSQAKQHFKFDERFTTIFWFLCFLLLNTWGLKNLPVSFWEIITAYSLLLFAIALSNQIKVNRLIVNLGQCAFGIYLIHPLVKSGVEIIIAQISYLSIDKVSIISMLIYSVLTFFISWVLVSLLIKNKLIAKYMFGF